MSNFKIIGTANPEIGKEIIYKTSISNLPASLPGQINPFASNPFTEQVKWSIYILEYGKWILKEKNNKTGPTANYTFTEISLKRQAIRIVALFGNEKATLDIKPIDTIERKIVKVELCDALGNLQTKPFGYNQTVLAKVHCLNLDNCTVHVTLWEDDAPKTGHSEINKNNKAVTKSELVSDGVANVKFKLAADFAKMANAQLAKGDKSEGKTHEYYVTAEIFRQETKASNNINVINPNDKVVDKKAEPQKPASQKPVTKPVTAKPSGPAAKKGPSKKEEKGIFETVGGTIFDWGESGFKAIASILPDPMEIINSVAKLDTAKKDEKKSDSKCVCKDYDLIWGNKVSCDFRKKVVEIAKRLGKDPNLLMAGMALETGKTFSPTVGKGSSYVGLIQFGDQAAESVGTTRNALLEMTALQQLDYVEKYLEKKKDKINTLTDFYLSILMPVDVGKGSESTHVVFDNKYPLKYKDNGTLTDLSKSRHFGYRQNPAFYYEGEIHKNIKITRSNGKKESYKELCDEKKVWFENGEKKYDGEGKTYIWEIEKSISNFYEEGKKHKASVFGCNKEKNETKTPSVESGTWNVIITENYTGNKCLHIEKTQIRKNCRRGNIKVYDHNKKLVLTISDCLLEGIKGEDRMKTSSDAPFGTYQINSEPFIMGSSSGKSRTTYGKNPRLAFEPINGSGDEADKSNRSLIRIHGGRQEDENFEPRKKPALLRTEGCIRVWDDDAKEFYDWWVDFHKLNPKVKPGKLQIIK